MRRYGCTTPDTAVCRYGMMVPRYTPYTMAPANTPAGPADSANNVKESATAAMDTSTV